MKKFIYWTPRILSIAFILFLAVFSLDVFTEGQSIGQMMLGLLMHNIPSIVLLIFLIIAWKNELVGAIVFILAGLLYAGLVINQVIGSSADPYILYRILIISGPAFLVGIMFYLSWRGKK